MRHDRRTCNGTCHRLRERPNTMPTGKRTPQTEAWRNMCIQRMASTGALAISSVSSSGCSWAFTAGSTRRRGRKRDGRRPRQRPICQFIEGERTMVTTSAHLLGKLSRVGRRSDDGGLRGSPRPDCHLATMSIVPTPQALVSALVHCVTIRHHAAVFNHRPSMHGPLISCFHARPKVCRMGSVDPGHVALTVKRGASIRRSAKKSQRWFPILNTLIFSTCARVLSRYMGSRATFISLCPVAAGFLTRGFFRVTRLCGGLSDIHFLAQGSLEEDQTQNKTKLLHCWVWRVKCPGLVFQRYQHENKHMNLYVLFLCEPCYARPLWPRARAERYCATAREL